jgi:hypothetical protein
MATDRRESLVNLRPRGRQLADVFGTRQFDEATHAISSFPIERGFTPGASK